MKYMTEFNLINDVNSFNEARAYLKDCGNTAYLIREDRRIPKNIKDNVISVYWQLKSKNRGCIYLTTKNELSENELACISGWVSGQASDGIGEGFSQQDFAFNAYESRCTVALFDWRRNIYEFKPTK